MIRDVLRSQQTVLKSLTMQTPHSIPTQQQLLQLSWRKGDGRVLGLDKGRALLYGAGDCDERKTGEEEANRSFVPMATSPGNNQRDNRKHSHWMCLHKVHHFKDVCTKNELTPLYRLKSSNFLSSFHKGLVSRLDYPWSLEVCMCFPNPIILVDVYFLRSVFLCRFHSFFFLLCLNKQHIFRPNRTEDKVYPVNLWMA